MNGIPGTLRRIDRFIWEVELDPRRKMRVPARLYLHPNMVDALAQEKSVEQLLNVATLPGIQRFAIAMPDIHQGYGFPVGGVAAVRVTDGVISPGGIGYDINCGVRLLTSKLPVSEIVNELAKLATQIQRNVPSGVGRGGSFELSDAELSDVLNTGVRWASQQGYALPEDSDAIENSGFLAAADAEQVSHEAKKRGFDQLGTIGSGNHFIEVQRVDRIFNSEAAHALGLFEDQVCVMIHTGSRGLGHQTCTDYVRLMNNVMQKYDIDLPDRELACVPFESDEGKKYFAAMAAAANFAWVNRQLITYQIRDAFSDIFGSEAGGLQILYDVSHNIAKREWHDGVECLVHRKGATRSFGPGSEELAPATVQLVNRFLYPVPWERAHTS